MRYYWQSFYQAKGDYDNLHQKSDKDIEYAVAVATDKVFYDDPLNLAIPYTFLLKHLPEPLDGALKYMLSFIIILLVYFI